MVTQAEVVRELNLTKGRVSQLVKAGMPLDSVESAKSWYAKNISTNRGSSPNSFSSNPEVQTASVTDEDVQKDTPWGVLARAKKAELVAYSIIVRAVRAQNVRDAKDATSNWRNLMQARMEAETAVASWQVQNGTLWRKDECLEYIRDKFSNLKRLLQTLPSSMASRCNPTDPALAESALDDGVEQIISTMRGDIK
jgi:hypothetical protein